ncbi:MAG: hypothetical protein LH606_00160 [Cytophagaceae bacterium]|nr:hypothetical protein [Cytophagaceae bacterium]
MAKEHGAFIKRQSEARQKVARFKKKFPKSTVEGLIISSKLVRQLIDHRGCDNLKFYYGLDDDGELTLILAPADAQGQRIGMILDADGTLSHPEVGGKDGRDDDVLNNGSRVPPPPSDL